MLARASPSSALQTPANIFKMRSISRECSIIILNIGVPLGMSHVRNGFTSLALIVANTCFAWKRLNKGIFMALNIFFSVRWWPVSYEAVTADLFT